MRSIKLPIRFKFDLDKLIASISFFADNKLEDLSKLKACKLLYYADKYHLVKHVRPIGWRMMPDSYCHMINLIRPRSASICYKDTNNKFAKPLTWMLFIQKNKSINHQGCK